MSEQGSVTRWIEGLKAGESTAARGLWEQYYRRLVGLARRKLGHGPRRVVDEEDIVQSAFASFCRGAREGRFPDLHDRHGLWPLLLLITERKAYDHLGKVRRREGKVHMAGESAVMNRDERSVQRGLDGLPGPDPTPAFAATMAESVRRLLAMLDDRLREVALLKLDGYTNAEIAKRIGRVVPTVELRLRMIRAKWKTELPA